ncbi:formylglycine-generating enzyme family protein [Pacificoceanicola onchidii]|uniref:formylglycine-generating enzyme family protein n=1 Tax=Pacificoceanicola onchidii TaxID=2562685 RepID=UPI0010A53C21|nr:formylglycine-generating enzyme family protein [Pacificoceanicola onchidii]
MSGTDGKSACCAPSRVDGGPAAPEQVTGEVEQDTSERVAIPGGRGLIGTDRPELPVDGEAPLREKRVMPFEMDTTVVTNARFRRFVQATGYVTDAERLGDTFVFVHLLPMDAPPSRAVEAVPWWRVIEGACWHAPLGPGSEAACDPDHPAVHVSWNDAQAFAKWAGGRLPSEAEWEHAARGGLGDVRFPWGDREPNDTDFFPCNIWQGRFPDENLLLDGHYGTAPARSFEPNGYGLYNMVGNVWEYTSQPFRVKSLKKAVKQAHAGKAGFKLSKGGSFLCHASYCYRYRIAARTGTSADSTTSHQGFRLVYDA